MQSRLLEVARRPAAKLPNPKVKALHTHRVRYRTTELYHSERRQEVLHKCEHLEHQSV